VSRWLLSIFEFTPLYGLYQKNLAVELLKKLIAEQVIVYKHTNVVKSEKFSEILQKAMNQYLNGMLTNEQVIE